eukprot:1147537-Pelagomonas_calceolata.AAC.10
MLVQKPKRTCALTPTNQGYLLNRIGASSLPGLEQVFMLNKATSPLIATGNTVNPCAHGDFFALAMVKYEWVLLKVALCCAGRCLSGCKIQASIQYKTQRMLSELATCF